MGGGDECGEEGRAPRPFIGSEGERGGRAAAAVVRHNGMKAAVSEGNRPGWWWGVMRSRCFVRYGSGGGAGRRRARTRDGGGRPGEEDDRAGPTRQRGRRGEGRVGEPKATGPAGRWASTRERGGEVGRSWVKNRKWAKVPKRNSFRILIDFRNLAEVWKIA
jgi:hypothetical protein